MIKVLLLVCSTVLPRLDCQEDTARVVVQGPDASTTRACALNSQAYFAGTALEVGKGEYLKIKCQWTTIGQSNTG